MPLGILAEKDYLTPAASLLGKKLTFEGLHGSVHRQVAAGGFRRFGIADNFERLVVLIF